MLYISYVLLKHGLDEIVLATHLFRPLRFLIYLSPTRWNGEWDKQRGVRIRETLEELGPIFVKFGQMLSTRMDLIPEDIALELVKLQDKVPPFDGNRAKKIVESALGTPISNAFSYFNIVPLASASVAQVHAATLLNGDDVVVKILRPNVQKIIQRDVDLIKTIALFAEKYSKAARRFKPKDIVHEFEKSVLNELDLMCEAANASQLRRNFQDSDILYVPKIHWPLTKNNILVMERIYGIPVSNLDALKEHRINLKKVAENGVIIFFTQVFRDCFFHADMHPGNLLISPIHLENPLYIAVDFGIIGTLGPEDQRYLAENFLAFFKRNYRRVAELHVESGWVPKHTRIDEFESAIRTVCEPIFEKPLKEVSFGNLLLRLLQTATKFNMNIQPQFALLQKTLINVEGLGRHLYPELDLWHTAKPVLETWMKNQVGVKSLIRQIRSLGPYWIEKLPLMPDLLYKALNQIASQPAIIPIPALDKKSKTSSQKAFWVGMIFGVLLGIVIFLGRKHFYG